jgi:CheY-like chemotaxis protein
MNNPALVLLVDDFEDNRDLYAEYLVYRGYHVVTADNGADGVRIACERRPDIILLDLRMPGMSGHEALQQMKAQPDLASVPVVARRTRSTTSGERQSPSDSTRSSPSLACPTISSRRSRRSCAARLRFRRSSNFQVHRNHPNPTAHPWEPWNLVCEIRGYSILSATTGSRRAARRAGI